MTALETRVMRDLLMQSLLRASYKGHLLNAESSPLYHQRSLVLVQHEQSKPNSRLAATNNLATKAK